MSETKWTPGPWSLDDQDAIFGPSGEFIGEAYDGGLAADFAAPQTANATLMAAAPDLYAALEAFVERMQSHGDWDDGCFYYGGKSASELQEPIRLARAALAAARGTSCASKVKNTSTTARLGQPKKQRVGTRKRRSIAA